MKCPYLQLVSFNVIKNLKKCKAVDRIRYCLMKDIIFVVGISFQENRCSWEWVHMSGLKYKPTVMVVSCMNKNISEEEKCGPVFPKRLRGAAAQQQCLVPAGCWTPPGAVHASHPLVNARNSLGLWWGTAGDTCLSFLALAVGSHGERGWSAVRPQILLMCAWRSKCYLQGGVFPVLAAHVTI